MVDVKDLLLPLLCLRCKNERNLLLYWKKKNNLLLDQTSKLSDEFLSFSQSKRERKLPEYARRITQGRHQCHLLLFFEAPHTPHTHTMGSRSSKPANKDIIDGRALAEKIRPPSAEVLLLGGRNLQFTSNGPLTQLFDLPLQEPWKVERQLCSCS